MAAPDRSTTLALSVGEQPATKVVGSRGDWNDERVVVLTELWNDGKSANECARTLNAKFRTGFSRNAVIGKVCRLGLQGRSSEAIRQSSIQGRRRLRGDATQSNTAKKVAAMIGSQAYAPRTEPCSRAAGTVDLVDLGAQHCRWPIGDPASGPFGFCGCAKVEGRPYCRSHCAQAYDHAANARTRKTKGYGAQSRRDRRTA